MAKFDIILLYQIVLNAPGNSKVYLSAQLVMHSLPGEPLFMPKNPELPRYPSLREAFCPDAWTKQIPNIHGLSSGIAIFLFLKVQWTFCKLQFQNMSVNIQR